MNITSPTLSVLFVALSGCYSFSAIASPEQPQLGEQIEKVQVLQQQYEQQLQQLKQLKEEYEQAQLPASASASEQQSYTSLLEQINKIQFSGFFRAKYDSDDSDPVGADSNNNHFYLNFEAKMNVSDDWDAHFQSETRKGYTVNQSWRKGDAGSSDQDGTVQRIWVEGNPYDINIALGTKWWGLGFQAVPFGHAADGISVDYDVVDNWNTKAFWLRPRQGDLVTMPNGQETQISGLNVTGSILDNLQTSLTFATNQNHGDDQKMSRMGAFELQYQATEDILLRSAFVKTNADEENTSQEYRIDYKQTNLADVGSYSVYGRFFNFERYGDYSHDDEWSSLPSDTRGWILGVKYVLMKNVIWESFYSIQERYRGVPNSGNPHRDLFRTQIDFHF